MEEGKKKYNHAYDVAFGVETDDPEHCTFDEWYDALVRRVSDKEEMRQVHTSEMPYDSYEN